jgi:hypothetical protein
MKQRRLGRNFTETRLKNAEKGKDFGGGREAWRRG